ncbi:MAG TPA: pyridoxal-phosphate dependent enzyme [Candidatus Binatia bacterium]|nr:pyridoxal-phosphate dependent enzyme [Candidatus Binatia bacterium]
MERSSLPLFRRFPGLAARLPRVALTDLPTPVAPLEQLGRERGIARLWIKRDDLTATTYGGNKPRKLEFLLGAAQAAGRRRVMTFGGIGTHHGLATTICARAAGMRTILVLIPQPVTPHVQRCLLLDHAYGAELHLARNVADVVRRGLVLLARGRLRGDVPAIIPTGGTSALGSAGYVNAALELAEQVAAGAIPEPDALFVPLGSGGTLAGLALGLRLGGLRTRVVGVLVTDILPPSPARLARLARACGRRLAPDVPSVPIGPDDFDVVRDWVGPGYGSPTPAAEAARDLLARLEGIGLETTYTAKCLAALLHLATTPAYRDRTLLFWNTFSSVDPGAALDALPDPRALPPAFHRFFPAS